jgi:hypothetical protein
MVSFESANSNFEEEPTMNEKLVAELAARVVNEMELNGHTFESGFREVLNQKWQGGNIPKRFNTTHNELYNDVKNKFESLSIAEKPETEEKIMIDQKMLDGAIAHENYHKKRLGDDY